MRRRRGFSLVEALLAFAVSVLLMAVLYTMLVSSRRGMVRGEGKLEYIGEANLLFQSLKGDLQALQSSPVWNAATKELKLRVWKTRRNPHALVPETVSYRLENGTIHRIPQAGTPSAELGQRRFGLDKVTGLQLSTGSVFGRPFLALTITFQAVNDAVSTEFVKSLFYHNLSLDATWNRIEG